jgi:hypothetical protein
VTNPLRKSDERLAWLAAKDYCTKKSWTPPPGYGLMLILTVGMISRIYREKAKETMRDYSFAVEDVTRRLSADERTVLRTRGTLPDWFLTAADAELVKVRRSRA